MYMYQRKKIWYVAVKQLDGKVKRISTLTSKKSKAIEYVHKNKLIVDIPVEDISLSDFKKQYIELAHTLYSNGYVRNIIHHFNHLEKYIGQEVLVKKLSKQLAESYLLSKFKDHKYTAHEARRTLSSAFNKAVSWHYIKTNPFKEIKLPKIPHNEPNYINKKELDKILKKETNDSIANLYYIAFYTGMRRNELINLRWIDVDFKNKEIHVRNSADFTVKNKEERIVPMNKAVQRKLRAANKTASHDYIFCQGNGNRWSGSYVTHRFVKAG